VPIGPFLITYAKMTGSWKKKGRSLAFQNAERAKKAQAGQ
jgi:hypothetical protein